MLCKDKFLLQSAIVPPNTDIDDPAPETFNKESGKSIEECKLRVVYMAPTSPGGGAEDEMQPTDPNSVLQRLRGERDAAVRQTQSLLQELDLVKRRKYRKSDPGFSIAFAISVGLIGILSVYFSAFHYPRQLQNDSTCPPEITLLVFIYCKFCAVISSRSSCSFPAFAYVNKFPIWPPVNLVAVPPTITKFRSPHYQCLPFDILFTEHNALPHLSI